MNDWDNDPDVGANGTAIHGLLPGKLIRITIESGQASPGVLVALFTDNSWEYYSEMYVEGAGEFVELTLAVGENVVLSQASGDNVQISIVYVTEAAPVDIYSQPSIVPAAVSSELDNHGEERIHIAPYAEPEQATPTPPAPSLCTSASVSVGSNHISLEGGFDLDSGRLVLVGYPVDLNGWYYPAEGEADPYIELESSVTLDDGIYVNVEITPSEAPIVGCLNLTVYAPH